jgi:hypothetical protein
MSISTKTQHDRSTADQSAEDRKQEIRVQAQNQMLLVFRAIEKRARHLAEGFLESTGSYAGDLDAIGRVGEEHHEMASVAWDEGLSADLVRGFLQDVMQEEVGDGSGASDVEEAIDDVMRAARRRFLFRQ